MWQNFNFQIQSNFRQKFSVKKAGFWPEPEPNSGTAVSETSSLHGICLLVLLAANSVLAHPLKILSISS